MKINSILNSYVSNTQEFNSMTNQVLPTSIDSAPSISLSPTQSDAPIRTKKGLVKKFFCKRPGCTSAFTTSGHLSRHDRLHTGEKNHPCIFPGCSSKFSRHDNMMQHYRTHLTTKPKNKNKLNFHNPHFIATQTTNNLPTTEPKVNFNYLYSTDCFKLDLNF